MQTFLAPFVLLAIVGGIVALVVRVTKTCNERIERWAAEHDYTVVTKQMRLFRRGPFFLRSTDNQAVYFVIVDDNGQRKEAFIRMGGAIIGLFSEAFQVRWVEPKSS